MARLTGLEPATPGVTGRYSNQLSYNRAISRSHRCNLFGRFRAAMWGRQAVVSPFSKIVLG